MNAKLVSLAEIVASVAAAKSPAAEIVARPMRPAPAAPAARPAPSADSARAFMLALRDTGKRRNDKGAMVSTGNPSDRTADEVLAIDAFIGYDKRAPHGAQLDAARDAAKRAMRPVTPSTAPYSRGTSATVAGYVAGINDAASAEEKQQATLKGLLRAKLDEAREALAAGNEAEVDRLCAEARNIRARII